MRHSTCSAHERACAVRLSSALVSRLGSAEAAAADPERVCGGLAALLALDADGGVRAAAAAAMGNAFVRLRRGRGGGAAAVTMN